MTNLAINHQCPHCWSENSAFTVFGESKSQTYRHSWWLFLSCGVCKQMAIAEVEDIDHKVGKASMIAPSQYGQSAAIRDRFIVIKFFPEQLPIKSPEFVPANVETVFLEAEASLRQGLFSAAASCYRKCVERSVKLVSPDGKGMLNARIRQIEKDGLLPKSLIDLLDQVRLLGNQAIHDDEYDPTESDCIAVKEFTELLLVYLFTLPAKISSARERLT